MSRAIKIAVLIPDRGDRPALLHNCMRMMAAQTVLPAKLLIVGPDVVPVVPDVCDITKRYRTGYNMLRDQGYDVIAFIENDDWYSPQYLETMADRWLLFKEPQLMGTAYTIYYHLKLRAWFEIKHPRRASAMNTFIKPDLWIDWPDDREPFTDAHIWKQMPGCLFTPEHPIAIGMKHGEGLCGGLTHNNRFSRFINKDYELEWLKSVVDAPSFEVYRTLYEHQPELKDKI